MKELKALLAKDPSNIGGNHYYIHVVEQSPHPERALENADRLNTLVPGSEHLVHMPTHIYFLTGRYHQGTEANLKAIRAFKEYNKACEQQGFKPEINYLYMHNFDFLRTTATMEGRKKLALLAAREMVTKPFPEWLEHESTLQWFIPIPYFVEARFGMWKELLTAPQPEPQYKYARGMWYYTQGLALAHTNQIQGAKKALLNLKTIIAKGKTESNLGKQGHNLLRITREILAATIADFQKNEETMFTHLQLAAKIQHDMGYHEPPDWYFPVKESLGDAYFKWDHPKKAIVMYEQVLKQYPKNGWALYGLAQALRKLGNTQDGDRAAQKFKEAWKYADIPAPIPIFK